MSFPSARRSLATVTVIVLSLLVPAPAGGSQHVRTAEPPPPRSSADACPDGFESPDNAFSDIGDTGAHVQAIRCAAFHGIATGGPGGRPVDRYGPGLPVSREQMATFVARLLDLVDPEVDRVVLPPWDGVNDFVDVSGLSDHVGSINRLADAGIALGGPGGLPDDRFAPGLVVTRAQMASFLNRTYSAIVGGGFDSQEVYFDDLAVVPVDHAHNINALAEEGVLAGRQVGTGWRYDPGGSVRRDQMASFLVRDLSLLVALDVVGHTFTEPAPGSGAEPRIGGSFPDADPPFSHLVDVRLATHEGFDRFVLEFDSPTVPAYAVRYVEPPIQRDGSGEPVVFSGDAYLSVDMAGASGFDFEAGVPTYTGPFRIPLDDGDAVLEAEQVGDFEALLAWVIGVDSQRPFTVATLTAPARLVVDVAVP